MGSLFVVIATGENWADCCELSVAPADLLKLGPLAFGLNLSPLTVYCWKLFLSEVNRLNSFSEFDKDLSSSYGLVATHSPVRSAVACVVVGASVVVLSLLSLRAMNEAGAFGIFGKPRLQILWWLEDVNLLEGNWTKTEGRDEKKQTSGRVRTFRSLPAHKPSQVAMIQFRIFCRSKPFLNSSPMFLNFTAPTFIIQLNSIIREIQVRYRISVIPEIYITK